MMKKFTLWATAIALLVFTQAHAQTTTVVLDFETAAKSAAFQYFGSSLEPGTTAVVNNPISSGINTSAKVSNFKKVTGGQTWAGAFSQSLPIEVNVINGGQICIKVLFKQAGGNVTLKLEGSSTGGPNWLRTINNTGAVDTWQEFCFDVSQSSIEAPMQPATGHSYKTAVLFMDFGETTTVERNYFFDDLVVKSAAAANKQVTFQVNMKGAPQPVNNVFVNGSFTNWVPKRLTKNTTDSIWKGTFSLPTGSYTYQFALDSPATRKEVFNGYELCTKNDTVRREIYRTTTIARDTTYPAVCYNSCYNCGDGVKITVNLGTSHIAVSPTGVYIAGGGNFGAPGDFPLTGAGAVKSITVERQKGFESFYTFTNGKCLDYSCKENIAGLSCANPANFNDRKMGPITQDTTINTCFALCTTTTTCAAVDSVNVTFRVNMRRYTSAFTQVYVSGSFNGWSNESNPLTKPVGTDSIWKTTIKIQKGTEYEYKFQLDKWAAQENFTTAQGACTKVDPSGAFRNRVVTPTRDSTLTDFCFNACVNCVRVNTNDIEFTNDLFKIAPSVSDQFFTLELNNTTNATAQMQIVNMLGRVVAQQNLTTRQNNIPTGNLSNGLYFVAVKVGNTMQTQKLMVQH
jgi:Secretion system C-terminal sorting domain/Carbohydrate-binding module 48 (Isoamylase N-terminal domain)